MYITDFTCRVCLQEQELMINVYDELEEFETNLSNLLKTWADFHINENDTFPKYICENCTRELLITSKFREKCRKSEEILYELLQNDILVENKELIRTIDIIEYCSEDSQYMELDDLIIEDSVIEEEKCTLDLINDVEKVEVDKVNETIKQTELSSQVEAESAIEKTLLYEDINRSDKFAVVEKLVEENYLSEDASAEPIVEVTIPKSLGAKSKKNHSFKCDVCGAMFKQVINLQKHFQKSHDIHYYTCTKCEYCISSEEEFYQHVKECNHSETSTEVKVGITLAPESNRKCIYCDRDFPTPFALRMHMRSHTGERPFHCKYCTKSFKTQSQLNVHHKRHSGQADFICTVCNKSFYEHSNLISHMRSHTGERPHICTVCNKTFTRVFLLQFHMRTHTGEKPFKCSYCDKFFRQQTDLRSHLTIHTGQKRHKCTLCGKAYIKRSHLTQHMRKHSVKINSEAAGEIENFEKEKNKVEPITAANITQDYAQNAEVVYNFDEIIESEDTHTDNFV